MSRRKELIETLTAMAAINGHDVGSDHCSICNLIIWHEWVEFNSSGICVGSAALQQCKPKVVFSEWEEKLALCDILTKEFGIKCRPS